ncbi:sensor histidine kinase [Actinocatenispora rupis]|uniref:histidine kinase n=1 Tax=Actinocatenispora rupis TaxID=519421 RepID=A0A8J3J963_9ACTN|nr:histidine kinase [Actinocatenispora rupis]GID13981.1 two-component sensor histidine kinase [Actinocatenispora rupis]
MFRRLASPQGWIHAAIGAAVWWPAGGFGLVAACFVGRTAVRPATFVVATVLVLAAVGFSGTTRRISVALANALLGTDLPAATKRGGWSARARSSGWLLVHAVGGGILATIAVYATIAGVLIPLLWISGGGHDVFDYFGLHISVQGGIAGIWTVPVGLAHVALVLAAGAGYVTLLRRRAPALLGPGAAERMAAVAEHADRLAHRNRLARELHDSIGHTLTASTIQAAVASNLIDSDPAAARRAMDGIEEASRTALEDLDHVLGVLRDGAAPTREPHRTLADVPALAARVRHAGTPVDVTMTGETAAVPATVSREAYRIVQEGVTNAMRHPGPVTVLVDAGPDRLEITVTNPLPAEATTSDRPGGRGLAGIAERVHVLRGEVTAGPVDDGRYWRLAAWLPVRSAP